MAQKPTTHLRRMSQAAQREANMRDKDNTKAVIEYMLSRGAFSEWMVNGQIADGCTITCGPAERLDWNPDAPKRITYLELREKVSVYNQTKRGRSAWSHTAHELRETVRVPHWDYDGMDPLILREPWERMRADNLLDNQAKWRASDNDHVWEIENEAHQLECAERLKAEGSACEWRMDCDDDDYWQEAA